MDAVESPKPRPYWHVDAKWISGLLLLFFLPITMLIFVLVQSTAPEPGITILTTTLASSYSAEGGGLDATGDIEIIRQKIAEAPDGKWQPIPWMRLYVSQEDISGKTPREIRLWFFRQWAEPLYYHGQAGLAELITDPFLKEDVAGPFSIMSADTHNKLQIVLIISGLVSLLFLVALIFFSYRFGRVGCPGCIVFVAAVPGFAILSLVGSVLQRATEEAAQAAEETIVTRYTQLAADVLPDVVRLATQIYLYLMVAGFVLVLISLVGGIIYMITKKEPGN